MGHMLCLWLEIAQIKACPVHAKGCVGGDHRHAAVLHMGLDQARQSMLIVAIQRHSGFIQQP